MAGIAAAAVAMMGGIAVAAAGTTAATTAAAAAGMTAVEGVVLYEEFGRSLAPSPHFVSAVLSGGALARSGSDELRGEWLPKIVYFVVLIMVAALVARLLYQAEIAPIIDAEKHSGQNTPVPDLAGFFKAEAGKHAAEWRSAARGPSE